MRIEGNTSSPSIQAYQQSRQVTSSDNKPSGAKNTRDEVNISREAKSLLQQHTLRDVSSPERSERLNQLRDAIYNGSYHVDSDKVVDKMIQYWKWK